MRPFSRAGPASGHSSTVPAQLLTPLSRASPASDTAQLFFSLSGQKVMIDEEHMNSKFSSRVCLRAEEQRRRVHRAPLATTYTIIMVHCLKLIIRRPKKPGSPKTPRMWRGYREAEREKILVSGAYEERERGGGERIENKRKEMKEEWEAIKEKCLYEIWKR